VVDSKVAKNRQFQALMEKKKVGAFHFDLKTLTGFKRISLLERIDRAVDTKDLPNLEI